MRHLVIAIVCAFAAAGCGDRRDNGTVRNPDVPARRTTTTVPTTPPVTGTITTTPRVREDEVTRTEKTDTKDVDNTGVNSRDRDGATVTPTDQKENEADLKVSTDIRKRLVDAKLSTDATNVKVVTQNGRVTLRGPVKSQDEKDTILRVAREVAGDTNVDDQIEIEKTDGR